MMMMNHRQKPRLPNSTNQCSLLEATPINHLTLINATTKIWICISFSLFFLLFFLHIHLYVLSSFLYIYYIIINNNSNKREIKIIVRREMGDDDDDENTMDGFSPLTTVYYKYKEKTKW